MISASASALLAAGGCATRSAAAAALAPTGRLRASINLGNPILANRDAATGQPVGVSVDLARALAARLGVGIELMVFDAAAKSVEAVRSGQADVGFFAIDPQRSDGIRFTAPYVLIEGAYLVRQGSALTDNAQVDSAGTRVMVGQSSGFMVIEQAMGLPANRGDAATQLLREFVESAKASGFVTSALQRHGIVGARVAAAG